MTKQWPGKIAKQHAKALCDDIDRIVDKNGNYITELDLACVIQQAIDQSTKELISLVLQSG